MSQPTCYPKATLKQYMSGWTDESQSSDIEAHLAECEVCEQTLNELEGEPETLLEFLHGCEPDVPASEPGRNDPVIDYALARAKQLGLEAAMELSATHEIVAPATLGPYDLLRPIGQGSMGRVYLAKHRQLGKLVAIKILSSRAFRSDETARRFQREVRAAGALQHASIINATDAGEVDGVHYLVMEYIEGLDLSRIARAVGRLTIADACEIGAAMALGLDHAHSAGVVHRDIKPSNVMLSIAGQVKLLDFGLAQTTWWDEASAELTTVGQLMGTIDYMAPEQAERADSVDYRADLYALGATLFRLLSGRAPHAASPNMSPLARLKLLATSTPPALRTLRPDAPTELERLIGQLLSREPDARPASAAHVAEQLRALSTGSDLALLVRSADQVTATPTTLPTTSMISGPPLTSPNSTRPPNRIVRWLLAAAAGAMSLAAIVLLTLETQKGQVVIESVDANVTVELSKHGQVQQQLKIVPGANSTRIAAGEYNVTIATGSDQFELDHETLNIKRGETVIARVRQLSKRDSKSQLSASEETPAGTDRPSSNSAGLANGIVEADEKVYEGKSLTTWRKQLMNEKSFEAIERAFVAIHALAEPDQRLAIAKEFLATFPDHLSDHEQLIVLQSVLWLAKDPEVFIGSVLATLSKVDDMKAKALLDRSIAVIDNRLKPAKSDIRLSLTLAEWSADFLREHGQQSTAVSLERKQLQEAAGFCIVSYLKRLQAYDLSESPRDKQVAEILQSSTALGEHFWLMLSPESNDGKYEPLPASLSIAVKRRATNYFLDSSDAKVNNAACLLLARLIESDRISIPRRAELTGAIKKRLHDMASDFDKLSQFVDLGEYAYLFQPPTFNVSPSLGRIWITTSFQERQKTNPCCDLLKLAAKLDASTEVAEEVTKILETIKVPMTSFATAVISGGSMNLVISWPEFKISSHTTVRSRLTLDDETFRDKSHPSKQEILAAYLYSQIESMLPESEHSRLIEELPRAMREMYVERQMKRFDINGDGQLGANELSNYRTADTNEDQIVTREELFQLYDLNLNPLEHIKR